MPNAAHAQRRTNFFSFIVATAGGLLAGRLLSEGFAFLFAGTWPAAFIITLLTTLTALRFRRRFNRAWPLLPAALYLFFPTPNWRAALVLSLLALFVASFYHGRLPRLPRPEILGASIIFTAAVMLYLATISPDILPADNGEFQLIGAQLGVAHPPGFPLYTLLAHAFSRLSPALVASPALAINAFSALTGAGTLVLLYLLVLSLTGSALAGTTAALALGSATTFWVQSTTANIRSLTTFFGALALYAAIRFWQEEAEKQPRRTTRDRFLILFSCSLSLGITHHLSLAFMGLIFMLFVLLADPVLIKTGRRWRRPLLVALLGALPLLYLPLRAGATVRGATAALATPAGFLNHFLGLGFQGDFFYFITPSLLWERLQVLGNVLTFQFSPWLLPGMAFGFILVWRRSRKLALLLGGSFALHALITATYRAPQTVEYMLPAYLPPVICLGFAVGDWAKPSQQSPLIRALNGLLAGALLLAAAAQFGAHLPGAAALHRSTDTRDYAQRVLVEAPDGALLLANWHWVTPLWYLQEIEEMRPDVTIRYVAPGSALYAETWAQRVQAGLEDGLDVVATWYDETAFADLPPPEPLGEAFLYRQAPLTTLPANLTAHDMEFAGVRLRGYTVSTTTAAIDGELIITTAWAATSPHTQALFAHLLAADGRSVAQSDQIVTLQPAGLTLVRFRLTPRPGTAPGEYTVNVGAGPISAPLSAITLTPGTRPPITRHLVRMTAVTADQTRLLYGYDWDFTVPGPPRLYLHWRTENGFRTEIRDLIGGEIGPLPPFAGPWGIPRQFTPPLPRQAEHYVPLGEGIVWTGNPLPAIPLQPGMRMPLDQVFAANRPVQRDYVVSVRFVGYEEDLYTWAWCDLLDGVPALGGIPTLKWMPGSVVRAPHTVIYPPAGQQARFSGFCQSEKPAPSAPLLYVAPEAVPEQTAGAMLRVYDAFTGRPLPILDERIITQYPWIPLGETFIAE